MYGLIGKMIAVARQREALTAMLIESIAVAASREKGHCRGETTDRGLCGPCHHYTCRRLWLTRSREGPINRLGKFNLHPVSVSKPVSISQPDIGGDLNDVPRVMPDALFVLIGSQQESGVVEDAAGDQTDRDTSSILLCFQANHITRKRISRR